MEKEAAELSLYKHWVAHLLAVQYITGVDPRTCVSSRGRGAKKPVVISARKLLTVMWTHPEKKQRLCPGADWVKQHLQMSASYLWRSWRDVDQRQVAAGLRASEAVYETLTQKDVSVAIAAGWTGREIAAASPWQRADRLAARVREHLAAVSQGAQPPA